MWITAKHVAGDTIIVLPGAGATWVDEESPSAAGQNGDFRTILPIGVGRLSTAPVTGANVNMGGRIAQVVF